MRSPAAALAAHLSLTAGLVLTAGLSLTAAPLAAQTAFPRTNDALTWQRHESGWDPAWFICDGIDRPVVHVMGALDARAGVTLWTYRKPSFRTARTAYIVGNDDPGMSQVATPLFPYPRGTRAVGGFNSFSPAASPDPKAATTGTFTSVRLGDTTTACRWLPNTRAHLFTPRRSVVVTREAGTYVYRSFDYAAPGKRLTNSRSTTPSLTLRGGRLFRRTDGAGIYAFANGRYGYRVTVSDDPRNPGASLAVTRDGRTLSTETAAGYTVARR